MVREGKVCASLARRDTAYAEEAADFGCVVGSGGEIRCKLSIYLTTQIFGADKKFDY